MKTRNLYNGNYLLSACLMLTMSGPAMAEGPLATLSSEASLVAESQTKYDRYELILSAIPYVVNSGASAGEGYRPEATETLIGAVLHQVHDYPAPESALSVYSAMADRLRATGFEVLFQCQGLECGDVAGWRLFMSEAIDGEIDRQYYLAARHPDTRGNQWYLAFYVNEFTDRPRSVMHRVRTPSRSSAQPAVNRALWGEKGSLEAGEQLTVIGFEFGSSKLTGRAQKALAALESELKDRTEWELNIAGHTDAVGEAEFNQQLSIQRARAVKAWLVNQGVDPELLTVKGYGAARLLDEAKPQTPVNRRVELRVLRPESAES